VLKPVLCQNSMGLVGPERIFHQDPVNWIKIKEWFIWRFPRSGHRSVLICCIDIRSHRCQNIIGYYSFFTFKDGRHFDILISSEKWQIIIFEN
jgi:hypothetical protein